MPFLLKLLLGLAGLAVGLVLAAVVAVLFLVLVTTWLLRAAWCRLTGRPVMPFAMRMRPVDLFGDALRRAGMQPGPSRTPRADAAAGGRGRLGDVTDVEPK